MNGGLRFRGRHENVLASLSDLGGDIASLVELQAKLTAIDAKETVVNATRPTILLVVAGVVLVSTLPVILIGLAFVIASALDIRQGVAMLLTGLVFAAIAGVVGLMAGMRAVKSFHCFRRSGEELTRNIAWVRTVIAQSGRSIQR